MSYYNNPFSEGTHTLNSKFEGIIKFIRKLYNKPSRIILRHEPVSIGNEKKYLADCIDSTFA